MFHPWPSARLAANSPSPLRPPTRFPAAAEVPVVQVIAQPHPLLSAWYCGKASASTYSPLATHGGKYVLAQKHGATVVNICRLNQQAVLFTGTLRFVTVIMAGDHCGVSDFLQ